MKEKQTHPLLVLTQSLLFEEQGNLRKVIQTETARYQELRDIKCSLYVVKINLLHFYDMKHLALHITQTYLSFLRNINMILHP